MNLPNLKEIRTPLLIAAGLSLLVIIGALLLSLWLMRIAPPEATPLATASPQQTHLASTDIADTAGGIRGPALLLAPASPTTVAPASALHAQPQLPPPLPRYVTNAATEPFNVPKGAPRIVLVIDDMGVNADMSAKTVAELPPAVTFSFLPYGRDTRKLAEEARQKGHEIMIHMPMEPMPRLEEPPIDPGPDALFVDLSPAEMRARTQKNLDVLKDLAVGVNNHMGSRFTSDEVGMETVLPVIAHERLFFMDSLTIAGSVVKKAAHKVTPELPILTRNVFLDHYLGQKQIEKSLTLLEEKARRNGVAIAIGHPHSLTLKALRDWLPTLPYKGIYLVPVTHVLPGYQPPAVPAATVAATAAISPTQQAPLAAPSPAAEPSETPETPTEEPLDE